MTKRPNGEGTVFKRGDGTWVVEITVPPLGTQPGYRKAFRGKTQKAVLERRAAFVHELAAGRPRRPRSATLGDYGHQYLEGTLEQAVSSGQLSDSTLATYRHLWNVHVAPAIGHAKFPDLTPALLQAWVADRAKGFSTHTGKPYSVRTQQAAYALLRAVLNEAVRDGYLDRNPLSPVGVRAPGGQKPKVRHIEDDDLDRLLTRVDGTWLGSLVLTMFLTGVRPGEALGVVWGDLDLERGTWHVSATLRRRPCVPDQPDALRRSPTKTKGSDATIPLSKAAVAELRRHRSRQAAVRARAKKWVNGPDYVFTTGGGRPLAASNVLRCLKREALAAGVVGGITLHRLRHSAGTAMIEEGVSPVAVSRMLRHRSVNTTLSTYAHASARMEREAVAAVDARYSRRHGSTSTPTSGRGSTAT